MGTLPSHFSAERSWSETPDFSQILMNKGAVFPKKRNTKTKSGVLLYRESMGMSSTIIFKSRVGCSQ